MNIDFLRANCVGLKSNESIWNLLNCGVLLLLKQILSTKESGAREREKEYKKPAIQWAAIIFGVCNCCMHMSWVGIYVITSYDTIKLIAKTIRTYNNMWIIQREWTENGCKRNQTRKGQSKKERKKKEHTQTKPNSNRKNNRNSQHNSKCNESREKKKKTRSITK